MKLKRAFTLLEMLVVIGIIAILVGLGAVSYSTAQKKARDAKRLSDLKSIQNAFEQYYSICNFKYPDNLTTLTAASKLTATTSDCSNLSANVDLITYPGDPLGGNYQCTNCDTTAFTVCPPTLSNGAYLETNTNCTASSPTCCLSNQQ